MRWMGGCSVTESIKEKIKVRSPAMIYLLLSVAVLLSVGLHELRLRPADVSAQPRKPDFDAVGIMLVVVIPTLLCALVIGLRQDTGTDYPRYINHFERIAEGANLFYEEPLYVLVVRLAQSVFDHPAAPFMALALITNGFIFWGIYRLKEASPFLIAAALFGTGLILLQTNLVRQSAAIAIFFCAAQLIWRGGFVRYTAMILLAAGFHYSVLILYPLYWVSRLSFSLAQATIVAMFSILLFAFSEVIYSLAAEYQPFIPFGYGEYIDIIAEQGGVVDTGVGILALFATSYLIIYSAYRYLPVMTREQKIKVNLVLFYLVLNTALGNISVLNRLSEYLALFLGVGFSLVAAQPRYATERSLFILVALIIFMVNFGWSLVTQNQGATPYNSILSVEETIAAGPNAINRISSPL